MKPKALWTSVFLASAIAVPAAAQHGAHGKPAASPDADALQTWPAVLLNGKPFPPVSPRAVKLPEPERTLFVSAGKENGDGSEQHPWNDLQAALCALGPGDRLRVRVGTYAGGLRVDEPCRDGTPENPIQVIFDGKARVAPGHRGAALTVRRAHWILVGLFLELEESPEPGVLVEGPGGSHVTLDGARIAGGTGPGVRIGEGAADVTVSNARIARKPVDRPAPSAFGVEIQAGTTSVRLFRNHLNGNPAGAIRVNAPDSDTPPARYLLFQGNAIHGGGATAIDVAAARGLRIEDNTLSGLPGRADTRGIALERAREVTVRRNVISGFSVGIQVGRANPEDGSFTPAEDVTIGRNYLESNQPGGAGIDIEAGRRARVANNAVEGFATGILVFGAPPQTQSVTIANNLFLEVADTAFVLADPRAVALFDYNIFSASAGVPEAQVGGETLPLDGFLRKGTMPQSRLAAAKLLHRDLARVSGAEVFDKGTAVPGLESKGSAPDIGVAER